MIVCLGTLALVVELNGHRTADSIRLQALDQKGQLQIRWDPESTPVRRALDARLFIVDGDQRIFVKLDTSRLRRGTVNYGRLSEHVDLRMALSEPDGKLVEEQTTFAGALAPHPPDPQLEALSRPREPAASEPPAVANNTLPASAPAGHRARRKPLVETGTQLPFTCSTGDVFHKTDASPGWDVFGCRGKNVWGLIRSQASGERSNSKPIPSATTLTAKPATASTT